jgi:hypothetical protein
MAFYILIKDDLWVVRETPGQIDNHINPLDSIINQLYVRQIPINTGDTMILLYILCSLFEIEYPHVVSLSGKIFHQMSPDFSRTPRNQEFHLFFLS